MADFDYLIVGSGLFGSVFAREMTDAGKRCLVIEAREHTGGNVYCEKISNVNVHKYGAHIFHTNNKEVWDYVNSFVEFNRFTNSPMANYKGKLFNLPFNMNTFNQLWGATTPLEAKSIIEEQKKEIDTDTIENLEDQAISLVGKDIYNTFIKGYTEKQWGRSAKDLPAFIIKRIPVRFTYDNNYFNDMYQGIPIGGYNVLIDKLLDGIEVRTGVNYFDDKQKFDLLAEKIVFTGRIDQFFDFEHGELNYRSLKFDTAILDNVSDFQGVAVVNYTEKDIPYTRIIEHKHFENATTNSTVITKEYPVEYSKGMEPYYPINDECNNSIYKKYRKLSHNLPNVIFGGRLAEYKYYDMHQVISSALYAVKTELDG